MLSYPWDIPVLERLPILNSLIDNSIPFKRLRLNHDHGLLQSTMLVINEILLQAGFESLIYCANYSIKYSGYSQVLLPLN